MYLDLNTSDNGISLMAVTGHEELHDLIVRLICLDNAHKHSVSANKLVKINEYGFYSGAIGAIVSEELRHFGVAHRQVLVLYHPEHLRVYVGDDPKIPIACLQEITI